MFVLPAITGALAFFTTLACAAPPFAVSRFSAKSFEITQLDTHLAAHGSLNASQGVTFGFHVRDPDPLTNATTFCDGAWKLNDSYPSGGYIPCANASFGWNFADGGFNGIDDFTIQVKHTFSDPSVGPVGSGWDAVTTFGRASVSESRLNCTTTQVGIHKGERNCRQSAGTVIKAIIWSAIA